MAFKANKEQDEWTGDNKNKGQKIVKRPVSSRNDKMVYHCYVNEEYKYYSQSLTEAKEKLNNHGVKDR